MSYLLAANQFRISFPLQKLQALLTFIAHQTVEVRSKHPNRWHRPGPYTHRTHSWFRSNARSVLVTPGPNERPLSNYGVYVNLLLISTKTGRRRSTLCLFSYSEPNMYPHRIRARLYLVDNSGVVMLCYGKKTSTPCMWHFYFLSLLAAGRLAQ